MDMGLGLTLSGRGAVSHPSTGPPADTKSVAEVATEAGQGLVHMAAATGSSMKKLTKASVNSVKSLGSRSSGEETDMAEEPGPELKPQDSIAADDKVGKVSCMPFPRSLIGSKH